MLIRGFPSRSPIGTNDQTQISSIVYAEFLEGLNSHDPAVVIETGRQLTLLDRLYQGGVPFDGETAKLYQVLSGVATRSGQTSRKRRIDMMIAASAIQYGAALATYNAADFTALGNALLIIDLSVGD
ncbi:MULTISPECIES: PIN domain-containing protein [unclassified Gordonia (in: high G+C Gram-positive bacteria)]|uniref:PIN domain-containing protein n=1 Tax=unclassified Gordonia (in: high G+C Gram-positive bacteria) TaxID=2657482 RepID=UPI0032D5687E